MSFANAAIISPASTAIFTALGSTFPDTLSENLAIPAPKSTICLLNSEKSLDPPNSQSRTPEPSGMSFANAINISPAIAATRTEAKLTLPLTICEKSAIPLPNAINLLAHKSIAVLPNIESIKFEPVGMS